MRVESPPIHPQGVERFSTLERAESPPTHPRVRSDSLHPSVTGTWWYRGQTPQKTAKLVQTLTAVMESEGFSDGNQKRLSALLMAMITT